MTNPSDLPSRGAVLKDASEATLKSRNASYGDPYPNLKCVGELMRVYNKYAIGKYSSAHDVAIYNVLMKLSRIACGATGHRDSYVDLAAYIAIAFECQEVFEAHEQVSVQNRQAAKDDISMPITDLEGLTGEERRKAILTNWQAELKACGA